MRLIFTLFLPLFLYATSFEIPIENVHDDQAVVQVPMIDVGVSGLIVRHFNDTKRSIIANAIVTAFDAENGVATLRLSPYEELKQNSLPHGTWKPKNGDIAILAYHYERALLIAPSDDTYHEITSRIQTLNWVHPDSFAAFLSHRGHPTPLKEDISDFCSVASAGLLYMYADNALFTIDCQSFSLLDITPFAQKRNEAIVPFYNRVGAIEASWFGKGSSELESYDPYYIKLLVLNNPKNQKLYQYLQSKASQFGVLLDKFEIEEAQ